MKPLPEKPSDACGKVPVAGFFYSGGFGVPLCADHFAEAKNQGGMTATIGDPAQEVYKAMVCYRAVPRPQVSADPPPIAERPDQQSQQPRKRYRR